MKSIREKSNLKKTSYSMIYADPTRYVRALENNNGGNEGTYPAHIVYKEGQVIPERVFDSGVMLINSKDVSL